MDHLEILSRLGLAAGLGLVVALMYLWARVPGKRLDGLASTILLLAPLIAIVTLAVGSNIAVAFTLVGTLAIVRFRTAIRDPQDTAYVIFSVAVGLASGNLNVWVALWGTAVVGLLVVGLVVAGRSRFAPPHRRILKLTLVPAELGDFDWRGLIAKHGGRSELLETSTGKEARSLILVIEVFGIDGAGSEKLVTAALAQPEVAAVACRPARGSD